MLDKEKRNYFLQRLLDFLRIKSISSDPTCKKEMLSAATFLERELIETGFKKTEIRKLYARGMSLKNSAPVLYAERIDTPSAPTVLIYGHYDVQPPDPLALWETPPFEPAVRGGKIFARGATDDKGQLYTHIAALKILSERYGKKWPLNFKILIEGEEESGGQNIEKLISENPKKFEADICLISDTGFLAPKKPAIEIGLRGIAYFALTIITAKEDLHSGLYGGSAQNPLNILSDLLGKMANKFGSGTLRKEPANASFPSFDIHGIKGGFQGEGSKTVIPREATAKFSIRLIPGQNPENIEMGVRKFVTKNMPRNIKFELETLGLGKAFSANKNGKYIGIAARAMEKVFGQYPVMDKRGGSIPVVPIIAEKLGAEVILMGYGLPDDNLHAPNEKLNLNQFYKGIECNVEFLTTLERRTR